ncbi:hypothetical protein UFOVP736_7 [uncultured Caudovirales phage]|uniref:Uncharacterized protein n=1 Tax=uncultured Caudovirales phage TaxID=2100421 RepID=A0A6J5NVS4_9CAUD|nr:hypothetical protein UFOVP705_74 [uncultured Caudovirales phage]CAB5223749.1 hypothetical protein UFOVP736_7 [uncultured Caudovirales phage]
MKHRLFALAAVLDQRVKHFEDDSDERAARVIGGGAVAAGVGAGGYIGGKKLRNAVINRAGAVDDYGNMVPRKGMYGAAAKSGMVDAKKAVKNKARGVAGDALGKGAGLLRKGAGVLAKTRGKLYGLASEERERSIGSKLAIGAGAGVTGYAGYRGYQEYKGLKKSPAKLDGGGGTKSAKGMVAARAKEGMGKVQDAARRGVDAAGDMVGRGRAAAERMGGTMKGQGRMVMKKGKRSILKGIARGKKLVGLSSLEDAVHELSAVMSRR